MGIIVSLGSKRIVNYFKGEINTIFIFIAFSYLLPYFNK